jgi:ketopantoate hydroxymethyltransferase
MERKVTVPDLQRMKEAGTKITALTAYDFPFGRIVDAAGIDVILVGDSLGMVVQGLDTTLPVEEGIKEIVSTLFEAVVLVIFVVYLFLQNWRATLIPLLTVPVSLATASAR